MTNQDFTNSRLESIYRMVEGTMHDLEKLKEALVALDKDTLREKYKDVPGVTGVYDGVHLVTEDGQKIEVPVNYAAKSRIVCGDTLKMIEEEGKQVFKQIEKIDRKKISGVLMKKEGKWHIISDLGTFRIADTAAEFQQAELSDEAIAFIPANNSNVPFAALDKVIKKAPPKVFIEGLTPRPTSNVFHVVKNDKPKAEPSKDGVRPARAATSRTGGSTGVRRAAPVPPKLENKPYKPAHKKEFVEDIAPAKNNPTVTPAASTLDEDDLR